MQCKGQSIAYGECCCYDDRRSSDHRTEIGMAEAVFHCRKMMTVEAAGIANSGPDLLEESWRGLDFFNKSHSGRICGGGSLVECCLFGQNAVFVHYL